MQRRFTINNQFNSLQCQECKSYYYHDIYTHGCFVPSRHPENAILLTVPYSVLESLERSFRRG